LNKRTRCSPQIGVRSAKCCKTTTTQQHDVAGRQPAVLHAFGVCRMCTCRCRHPRVWWHLNAHVCTHALTPPSSFWPYQLQCERAHVLLSPWPCARRTVSSATLVDYHRRRCLRMWLCQTMPNARSKHFWLCLKGKSVHMHVYCRRHGRAYTCAHTCTHTVGTICMRARTLLLRSHARAEGSIR
jgi:hypothetical protein